MLELKHFLKSKLFLKNLGAAILIIILFFWGAAKFLSFYTRHGEFITLPNLSNKKLTDVEKLLSDQKLNYVIIDSTYDETLPPGTVINQNPYAGAHVKSGRNVYLYITSAAAPMVEVPNMVDKSLRQATLMLENSGLKLGDTRFEQDPCNGCVLRQTYKGKIISPGTKIPKGSAVNLVVGKGNLPDSLNIH